MQKKLSYEELSRLEDIFDDFVKTEDACLSEVQKQESLNDFVATYRDGDDWQTLEQFEKAVKNGNAWTFKCDTSRPDDPTKKAEEMDDLASGQTAFNGYKMKTTFWTDFTIADKFGAAAVQDTFDRAFSEWRGDVVYLTELVLVLNWKIHVHFNSYEEANGKAHEFAVKLMEAQKTADKAKKAGHKDEAKNALVHACIYKRKQEFNEHKAKQADELARLYNKLWQTADGFACDNLKGDEMAYFYNVTD